MELLSQVHNHKKIEFLKLILLTYKLNGESNLINYMLNNDLVVTKDHLKVILSLMLFFMDNANVLLIYRRRSMEF